MSYLKNIFGHTKWSATASVFTIFLQAALYLVITRYISPEDLGIYALSSSFIFIGVTIVDNSFTSSLIHKSDLKKEDYQAIFTLNLISATILGFLALILSFAFDLIFQKTRIMYLVLCLSPILFLSAFNSIKIAELKLKMNFRFLAIAEIISMVFFFMSAVTLSFFNFSYWSLIVAVVVKYTVMYFLLLINREIKTAKIINYSTPVFKQHWDYGKYIIGEKGLSSVFSYIDVFLINHYLGLQTLGIYDVLKKMIIRPLILLYNSIEQVLFPMLSKTKTNRTSYNQAYNGFMEIVSFIYLPAIALLFINRHLLLGFFPEDYASNGMLAGLIIIWSASIILINPLDIIMYSVNRTKQFFNWFVVTNILLVIIMVYFVQIDIEVFVSGIIGFNLLVFPASYFLLVRKLSLLAIQSFFGFFFWIVPVLLTIILMEITMGTTLFLISSNTLVLLITCFLLYRSWKKISK